MGSDLECIKGSAYTIVIAHTSAHLEILGLIPIGDAFKYSDIFARFKSILRK